MANLDEDNQISEIAGSELQQQQLTPLALIQTAMADKEMDPDRLGKFLDVFERMTAADAKKQFNQAMNAAMKDMPRVVANRTNDQTSSPYVDLEKLDDVIRPIYLRHGLTPTFGTAQSQKPDHILVTCDVLHNSGHEKHYEVDMPIDDKGIKGTPNKTGVWGSGSTMSYSRRYLELLIWNIAVHKEDDDGQAASGNAISGDDVAKLNDLILKAEQNLPGFLKWLKVESLDKLPKAKLADAVRFLENKAANVAKAKAAKSKR